ncbi:hypothetical protein [Pseudomonas graminis]|uniref:hypothetical protein n=1 Tax=Pseudomonas graminis TaxID=158627 RepID=UPI00094546E7|nr:hypothetical protein [Pseudomonas graminis]
MKQRIGHNPFGRNHVFRRISAQAHVLFKLRAVSIAEHAQCIHSIEHRRLAGCGALLVLECIGRRQWPVDRVEQLIANCSTPILDFHAVDHFVLDDAQTGFDHYRRRRGLRQ